MRKVIFIGLVVALCWFAADCGCAAGAGASGSATADAASSSLPLTPALYCASLDRNFDAIQRKM